MCVVWCVVCVCVLANHDLAPRFYRFYRVGLNRALANSGSRRSLGADLWCSSRRSLGADLEICPQTPPTKWRTVVSYCTYARRGATSYYPLLHGQCYLLATTYIGLNAYLNMITNQMIFRNSLAVQRSCKIVKYQARNIY